MLRLLTYLVSFFKALILGRWYPPAHVRDVSASEYLELAEKLEQAVELLEVMSRQVEATRKKVYRDEAKAQTANEIEAIVGKSTPAGNPAGDLLSSLRSGDSIPPNFGI